MCYPTMTDWGLPFPSPHQLLIPSIPIIPFPSYFPELYSFLFELNNFSQEISLISEEYDENSEYYLNIESIAEKKVKYFLILSFIDCMLLRTSHLLPHFSGSLCC